MTVSEYVSHPGTIKCPSCGEDCYIDSDEVWGKLKDLHEHGVIVCDCYHCPASYTLRDDWTVELMYDCRFCDSGENFPEHDTWNQSTEVHSTVQEPCENCGRGKW
jgi:hypothetical protein